MADFQEIIARIMEYIDHNPELTEDQLIRFLTDEYGLNKEVADEISETFTDIDRYNEKSISLDEAREEGATREEWLESQLADSVAGFDDNRKEEYLNNLSEALNQEADRYIENEEAGDTEGKEDE